MAFCASGRAFWEADICSRPHNKRQVRLYGTGTALTTYRLYMATVSRGVCIAVTRPSSGTFLPRTPPSSYPIPTPYYSPVRPREDIPDARFLLRPTWVALSREMPASLALLPRPVGGHLPTRGASLLGPTPAASQTRLLAYSLLLPPSRGGARAPPSAPSCPFSPGAAQWSRHPARARCRASWPYITPPMSVRRRAE